MSIKKILLGQVLRKPYTNPFPAKHAPNKVADVKKPNEPVPVPDDFRGKIKYDRKKCIGCKQCITVCPANCFDYKEKEKKIRHHVLNCLMCGICTEICPTKALTSSKEYLLAETDKKSKNLIEE
ncbi:4Fe-4S dicluster domain-containing protein [Candidatus Woesearchaeota archaeon]|nr:4Fe-4S dicluster domain-containing protein [Candidatus Woesearchaeota archaeon]